MSINTFKKDYSGILTIDLDIPLKQDGSTPDFDNPRIVLNTYNKNIKKVRLEDLSSHSQNLLDKETISTESYLGQHAIDNGFTHPNLRAILFKDEQGKYVSQLKRNKKYYISPLIGLPILSEDNGYGDYIGYAYKWEIIVHNNNAQNSEDDTIRDIPWTYVVNSDGTIPDLENAYVSLDGSQETLNKRWDNTSIENRTQLASGFPDPSISRVGDLHRIAKVGSSFKGLNTQFSWRNYTENGSPRESYSEPVALPQNYLSKNTFESETLIQEKILVASDSTYDDWKNIPITINPTTAKAFQRVSVKSSNKIKIPDTPNGASLREYGKSYLIVPEEFEYYSYEGMEGGVFELNNRMKVFSNSTSGIQVRLFISPVKKKSGYNTEDLEQMDLDAQIITSAYMPYETDEVLLPQLNNTSTILESKFVTFFDNHVVLYGGTTHGNIIYLSDEDNIGYFPFKYSLDQIPQEIIHIHPFQSIMVVFTKSDIWSVEKIETENEYGVVTIDFIAKKILQNVFIDVHLKNAIRTVGKYIMVFLEDKIIFLKPNSFTGDLSDLSFVEVSSSIGNILKDPMSYVKNRLRFYNIFDPELDKFDLFTDVDNKDFKIILSSYIISEDKPYMLELKFDGNTGVWTLYDTLSTAYPISISGSSTYMKSHPNKDGGIVISDNTGYYKYKLNDIKESFVDYNQFVFDGSELILRETTKKEPINTLINFGNMPITNHLNKRFHEVQFEMSNINSNTIEFAYEFRVDGKVQQSSDIITTVLDNNEFVEEQFMDFEVLDELSNMTFSNFKLDLSKFPVSENLTTRISANGRGRNASLRMSFNTTNDFEFFRTLVIYKEQTTRKVI